MFVAKNSNTFIFNLLSYSNIPTVKGLLGITEHIFSNPGSKRTIKQKIGQILKYMMLEITMCLKNHKYQRDKL